jgi:hypothetical protein
LDFTERYRAVIEPLFGPLAPDHGFAPEIIKAGERRRRISLPPALRQFYAHAGRLEPVMAAHNRFCAPADIRVTRDMVVFLHENQWVVSWGLKRAEIKESEDPPVYQGRPQGKRLGGWVKEEDHCSDFLAGMVYWQALNGGLPIRGERGPLLPAQVDPVRGRLPLVWQDRDTQVFSQRSWVVGLTMNRFGEVNVELAYRDAQDRRALAELAQVDWLFPNLTGAR